MNRRQLDDLHIYARYITDSYDAYERAMRDYVRGGLPTTSLPTGQHATEPALPTLDHADQTLLGRKATSTTHSQKPADSSRSPNAASAGSSHPPNAPTTPPPATAPTPAAPTTASSP